MGDVNTIQSKIMQMEGGAFKGTPDAYVLTEDGKYILINYGSVSSQPADKIRADILSCFNTAKLSLENKGCT